MYGAILGDIIGSPFEFDRGDKTKEFDLFTKGCDFTDDSVMTIAVGEALLAVGPQATVKEIEEAVVTNMQDWGKRYPYAGYGGRFRYWLREASVYKGYKRDKIEMRGDRAEMSDFPLYLNTVAGGLDRRDQTIGGFSFVVKIYALPVVEIIGQLLYLLGRYGFNAQFSDCL